MNVLIVNFEYPPLGGGGGVATKDIAQELAKRHQVTVLTSAYQNTPRRAMEDGITVIRVPAIGRRSLPTASLLSMLMFVPAAAVMGMALCMRQRFSVINAQFVVPSGIPAAFLSWLFRIPLVVTFIGGDIYDPTKGISPHRHPVLRFLIRRIVGRAAACTAISEDTKRRAQELHGVTKEITVTHLGIHPSAVTALNREQLGLPREAVVAVSIGRLIPRKSYQVLLEAWAEVSYAHLVILGDGPLKDQLQQWVIDRDLQDRVRLVGFVSEERKLQFLQTANLYVSAAEHEGFGIVFLEAMDAGLPIVAVDEGGQTDFLHHGKNALLVPAHNPKALTEAIKRLVDNVPLRQVMAVENKQAVREFYLETTVKRFEEVLLSVTPQS